MLGPGSARCSLAAVSLQKSKLVSHLQKLDRKLEKSEKIVQVAGGRAAVAVGRSGGRPAVAVGP